MTALRHPCHLVSGPPAAGKTTYGRNLARTIGGCLIDSDEVAERLVQAGLRLAGLDPDDRDSPAYKQAYRTAVYDTMFGLARSNLPAVPVVLAGPFTREGGLRDWPASLERELGVCPEMHFVWCDPATRKQRIMQRGQARDQAKLAQWETYLASCREAAPVWPHRFVDTASAQGS